MQESLQPTHRYVHPKTFEHLQHQLSVIRKIVVAVASHYQSRFPGILLYQVSRFIFHNPLVLKQGLFCFDPDSSLSTSSLHLLVEHNSKASTHLERVVQKQAFEEGEGKSAYVSIGKQWKAMRLSENANYNQVLQKGTLFLSFLSNIKIYPLDYKQQAYKPSSMLDNRKLQQAQKQKNKTYYLISDNLLLTHVYFSQIFKYKQDKKINDTVIKAFTNLMTKHILALKIERNYNTQPLGFEENYLIIEHQKPIPLAYQKQLEEGKQHPSFAVERDQWKVRQNSHFLLYREVRYPFSRKEQLLITPKLRHIYQRDVWIREQSSGYLYPSNQESQQKQQ